MFRFVAANVVDGKKTKKFKNAGSFVTLVSEKDNFLKLFFPLSSELVELCQVILDSHEQGVNIRKLNPKELGELLDNSESLYQRLSTYLLILESWENLGHYLSGVYLDTRELPSEIKDELDQETQDLGIISTQLILTDDEVAVANIIDVNFGNAIILALIEKAFISVNKKLMKQVVPQFFPDEAEEQEGNNLYDMIMKRIKEDSNKAEDSEDFEDSEESNEEVQNEEISNDSEYLSRLKDLASQLLTSGKDMSVSDFNNLFSLKNEENKEESKEGSKDSENLSEQSEIEDDTDNTDEKKKPRGRPRKNKK